MTVRVRAAAAIEVCVPLAFAHVEAGPSVVGGAEGHPTGADLLCEPRVNDLNRHGAALPEPDIPLL